MFNLSVQQHLNFHLIIIISTYVHSCICTEHITTHAHTVVMYPAVPILLQTKPAPRSPTSFPPYPHTLISTVHTGF